MHSFSSTSNFVVRVVGRPTSSGITASTPYVNANGVSLVDLLLVTAQDGDVFAGVEEPRRESAADIGRGRVDDDGHV